MTPEAREALKASIKKWEAKAAASHWGDVNLGSRDCPLCQVFHPDFVFGQKSPCIGCPVRNATGPFCLNSPFTEASEAYHTWRRDPDYGPMFRAAAQVEVKFLKSLLEAE